MSQRVNILLSLYRLSLRVPVEVRVEFFTGFLEARASHLQALSLCGPAGAEVGGEACIVRALLSLIVHQDELLSKRLAQAQSRLLLLLSQKGHLGGGQTRGYA